jgi:hypothetical protein
MTLEQLKQLRLTIGLRPWCSLVGEFMAAADQLPPQEGLIPAHLMELGRKLVHEEVNEEFFPALQKFCHSQSMENRVELLDAIADSIYVLIWTALACRLPIHDGFAEVCRSNLDKVVDGKLLKNPETGKVMKPAGWRVPDLLGLLVLFDDSQESVVWRGSIRVHNNGTN